MAFGVYVHFPFCAAKCPYCDFNAHVRTVIDEEAWVSGVEICESVMERSERGEAVVASAAG